MKTALLATALAIAFLGAGAFASGNEPPPPMVNAAFNVTVVSKNQAWPVKGPGSIDACRNVRCVDI